jgi:hypothetical protein
MSTKNVSADMFSFDPAAMKAFQSFMPQYQANMQQFMTDPMKSSFFNTQMAMQNAQNRAYFGGIRNQMNQNMAAGGYVGNMPAFMQDQNLNISRGLAGANANTFNNLLLGTNQLRFGATQAAGNFRPLQTGGTRTQTQSGLGSWLPQVLSGGMGLLGMAMGGPAGASIGSMIGGAGVKSLTGAPSTVDPSMMPSGNTLSGDPGWGPYDNLPMTSPGMSNAFMPNP